MQPPTGDSDSNLVVSESKSERQVTFIISGLGARGHSFFLHIHVSSNEQPLCWMRWTGGVVVISKRPFVVMLARDPYFYRVLFQYSFSACFRSRKEQCPATTAC